ncbi:MAG: hypothetical protein EBR20_09955 [Bacteroidetes bacterium]|nr:hypothetical protein [Bacteroidota bacterium]
MAYRTELLWQKSKETLAEELPTQQFQTWIHPLSFLSGTDTGQGEHISIGVVHDDGRDRG